MTPIESRQQLEFVTALLAEGKPLPPHLRAWFVGGLRKRLSNPETTLDAALWLRSRAGGRLGAFSRQPERDRAVQALATGTGKTVTARAEHLVKRVQAYRVGTPDPELTQLEATHGKLPCSVAQFKRILGGHTRAAQYL